MSKFISPSWEMADLSGIEKGGYRLEVLKGGVSIGTEDLSVKTHFIAGRQPDISDIQLDHPSISREHAAFVISSDSCLFLVDLRSAQGTSVNKVPLEPNRFERLFVGDIVRFGASTRMYLVHGPDDQRKPEYDSANLQAYREKLVRRSAEAIRRRADAEEDEGVSWGFREDAPADEDDEPHGNVPR